ncbi:bifunctional metallophosphatase/5'-nucleotidase [Polluticoccus soli]|uniref:bifunctional metallophosphatase/5'-nucleotidase n=1 Tax=Polluticoccus soli TaxID=3034150 RepID=UPI0023E1513A|nr:5'-nucleotidase C-terminal domain-containing protein [Flavipsychrobacter sp. JY13-12]
MQNRRDFLRNSALAGMGFMLGPADVAGANKTRTNMEQGSGKSKITILHTTDVHCQLHPHDEMFWENDKMTFRKTGGYAHIDSYFQEVRNENPNTIIVDTGDMFQGSELSVKTSGNVMPPILNAMGYGLFLPGNWEVVYGKQQMLRLMGSLNAPKTCANMYHDLGDGRKGELIFPPYHIWNIAGVKIGFIGYTDHLVPVRQSPMYSKGIVYTEPEENIEHYVTHLRRNEQCQFVIVLSHLGLSQQIALANNPACEGVDYILGGDTHERVRKPIECTYAKVVEPGAFGSFTGRLDLIVENGNIIEESYELVEMTATKYRPTERISRLVEAAEAPMLQEMNKIIGYSTIPLYRYFVIENTIDTLITNAVKWKVNADIALSNGFRFCPPRVERDKTGNIPITEAFLYDMLPVDSKVRTAKATGRQIVQWLEKEMNNVFATQAEQRFGGWLVKFSGMNVVFEAHGAANKRIKSVHIGGEPIQVNRIYMLSACEREGDPDDVLCRLKGVESAANTSFTLHEAVKEYLAAFSPVTPEPPGNAVATDVSRQLLTQVTGVDYKFT